MTGKPENTLDDALIALQKSFSRVNYRTAEEDIDEDAARAMMVGNVNFEISLSVEPENDYLILNNDSNIHLKLNGTIDLDIREEDKTIEDKDGK